MHRLHNFSIDGGVMLLKEDEGGNKGDPGALAPTSSLTPNPNAHDHEHTHAHTPPPLQAACGDTWHSLAHVSEQDGNVFAWGPRCYGARCNRRECHSLTLLGFDPSESQ